MNRKGLARAMQASPIKHDLTRRRTLKHKSLLLRQYGVYALTGCYLAFGLHCLHKFMYPPEYKTEEEREKAQ